MGPKIVDMKTNDERKRMKLFLSSLLAISLLFPASLALAQEHSDSSVEPSAVTVTKKPTRIGIKAGLSSATFSQSAADRDVGAVQRRLTLNAALFLTRRITQNISLQFEAMLSDRGARIGSGVDPTSIELRYAVLPTLLRFELTPDSKSVRPYLMAGGSLAMLLSARNEGGSAVPLDIRANTEELELGGVVAAGIEVPHAKGAISVELRYSHGFTSIVREVRGVETPLVHNRVTSVLFGYAF